MRPIEKADAMELVAREIDALPPRFRGCIMCAMAEGAMADLETIATSDAAIAVLDRYASRPGHVLVVLRRHVESIAALPWDEYADVQRLAWQAVGALHRALGPKRVFVAALGAAQPTGISFPHHHVHAIPLFDGGAADRPAEVFSWTRSLLVYEPGEAPALAARLRAAWSYEA